MLNKKYILLFILILGFGLRLINLNQSFWLDEAITALQTRYSINHYVTNFAPTDFHPPLYYFLIKLWSLAVPINEITLRLPSIIFGTLSIIIVFLIVDHLFPKTQAALLAAILTATAPLHLYYSQEARMYILALFFSSLSALFFLKLRLNKSKKLQVGFILSTASMISTHYLTLIILPVFVLCSKNYRRTIIHLILSLSILIPWLPTFLKQLSNGFQTAPTFWGNILGRPTLKNLLLIPVKFLLGRVSINNNTIYALAVIPLILFYSFLFYQAFKKHSLKTKFFFAWLIIPTVLAFIISFIFPVLSYFRLIFILPAIYILAAIGYSALKPSPVKTASLSILIFTNLISSYLYLSIPKFQRENWRQAISYTESKASKHSFAIFAFPKPFAPWQWYQTNQTTTLTTKTLLTTTNTDLNTLFQPALSADTVFVFEYLMDLSDPNRLVLQWFKENGFSKIEQKDFHGVGFIHIYQKSPKFALN